LWLVNPVTGNYERRPVFVRYCVFAAISRNLAFTACSCGVLPEPCNHACNLATVNSCVVPGA
jgi:hypothetical protein